MYRNVGLTWARLQEIVATNDKQRFALTREGDDDPDPSQPSAGWLIRASQGHSIPIQGEDLGLERLTSPGICVHGTYYAFYEAILQSGGLKRMDRVHIHLSSLKDFQQPGGEGPISGMRYDAELVVVVDGDLAARQGIVFWKSANGVVLTTGDSEGCLPLSYVLRIQDRGGVGDAGGEGLGVLWEGGRRVRELPEELSSRRPPRGKPGLGRGRGGGGSGGKRRVHPASRGSDGDGGSGIAGGPPIDAGDL